MFALAVVTLAVLFACCSLPIYRLLEGYTLPTPVARRRRRRQLREWHGLAAVADLKGSALAHLPSGWFMANAAWLVQR